jgi:hypothetical protein
MSMGAKKGTKFSSLHPYLTEGGSSTTEASIPIKPVPIFSSRKTNSQGERISILEEMLDG